MLIGVLKIILMNVRKKKKDWMIKMEKGKAYISFTPVGVGKEKNRNRILGFNRGDTQIMKLGYGTFGLQNITMHCVIT